MFYFQEVLKIVKNDVQELEGKCYEGENVSSQGI